MPYYALELLHLVTDEHFKLVIDALKNGVSVAQLAMSMREKNPDFPSAGMLYDYANATEERRTTYKHAREQSTHALADQIVQIADTVKDPQRARNMINARQWVASKINHKNYGDKLDMNVETKVDITLAVSQARNRLASMRSLDSDKVIDITPEAIDIDPFS